MVERTPGKRSPEAPPCTQPGWRTEVHHVPHQTWRLRDSGAHRSHGVNTRGREAQPKGRQITGYLYPQWGQPRKAAPAGSVTTGTWMVK